MRRKNRFALIIISSVLISLTLAAGHVFFGRELMNVVSSQQALETLDSYVFYLSLVFVTIYSGGYFIFTFDLSESLAVVTTGFWALLFGLEDIFVYGLLGYFEQSYPWLEGTLAGAIPSILGVEITTFWLFFNTLFTGLITAIIVMLLYEVDVDE